MKRSTHSPTLPPLPFGDRQSVIETNVDLYVDRMSKVISSLKAYDPLEGANRFASKSTALVINGVKLVAGANTPVQASVGETTDTTLMVPFFGSNFTTVGNEILPWVAGQGAVYLPSTARGGQSSTRSVFNVSLEPLRLKATAGAMLGTPNECNVDLQLDRARAVPFKSHGLALERVFHHVCAMIDSVDCNPQLLELLGVDDLLYRNIVLMLRPDLFVAAAPGPNGPTDTSRPRRALDPLCDYLLAHLGERITLTDMERISGVSSRGLQYAFLHRFGCSPLQWLRGIRLEQARRLIVTQGPATNITQLAMSCGFTKPSDFAEQYRRRFGELPSQARARA